MINNNTKKNIYLFIQDKKIYKWVEINFSHFNLKNIAPLLKKKLQLKEKFISIKKLFYQEKDSFFIIIDNFATRWFVSLTKFRKIICVPAVNEYTAEMSRKHNNAKILLISKAIVGKILIEKIIKKFLNTPYEAERHEKRLKLLKKKGID